MAVPILAAYGVVYHGGLAVRPVRAARPFIPLLMLPAVVGHGVTLVLVNVFPARRTRDLLSIIALGAAAASILLFRHDPAGAAGPPGGVPNLARLHRGAAHADVAAAAERVGDPARS